MNNNGNGAALKVLFAGGFGNFVELYDFVLYGYFATTIAHLFFPTEDPTAGLLSTFVVFAVGFFARPLGGVVFGHFGDRFGRRAALIVSVLSLSAATVILGLLPGYNQIGIVAPLLLFACRIVQGFSAGGEYTSASIFLIEHAPHGRRGRYASVGQALLWAGGGLAALVSLTMTSMTTTEQLASWGWRVPFLLAAPLALIGLYLRLRVEDSPVFTALQDQGQVESAPLVQALKVAKKPILVLIGWAAATNAGYYLTAVFLVSYLTTTAHFSHTASLLVQFAYSLGAAACSLLAGPVVDWVGRRRVVAAGSMLCVAVWAIPSFVLFEHSSILGACLIVGVFAVLFSFTGVMTVLNMVELYPARVRSSASGIGYNFGNAIFGGSAPYVATWLVGKGSFLGPGYYLAGLAAVATLAAAIGIGTRAKTDPGHDVMHAPIEGTQEARA